MHEGLKDKIERIYEDRIAAGSLTEIVRVVDALFENGIDCYTMPAEQLQRIITPVIQLADEAVRTAMRL